MRDGIYVCVRASAPLPWPSLFLVSPTAYSMLQPLLGLALLALSLASLCLSLFLLL